MSLQLEETCLHLMDLALSDDRGIEATLNINAASFVGQVRTQCYEIRARMRNLSLYGTTPYDGLRFIVRFTEHNVTLRIEHQEKAG